MMRSAVAALVPLLLLAACTGGSGNADAGTTLVYTDAQARQCETTGIPLAQSAQTLIDAGIDVLESWCGVRTGVAHAAVCGGQTGDIRIHEIPAANVAPAREAGYAPVSELVDAAPGTGYMRVDCPGGEGGG